MNHLNKRFSIWWGPPRQFTAQATERRVSWLELFYDLVYVIAIARITHHLSAHLSLHGFLEFIGLFALIYWGWLNGSLHHDLHGNQGLRSRLMMLWQMMIISALSIMLGRPMEDYTGITVIFMAMQLYVTYQWWSVGLYDKVHKKYSWPYTLLFLVSFSLMGLSLWLPKSAVAYLLPVILLCNYAPPFISHRLLMQNAIRLDLSSSMFERLGLFTIILFGEVVIGVVNGVGGLEAIGPADWLNFALAIAVVFSLWWIFFVLVSSRKVKEGLNKASLLELLYIPSLIALGSTGAVFSSFFAHEPGAISYQTLFGLAILAFLCCIFLLMGLLVYPSVFDTLKRPMRVSLLITAAAFLALSLIGPHLSLTAFLIVVEVFLICEISYLNYTYYSKLLREGIDPGDV